MVETLARPVSSPLRDLQPDPSFERLLGELAWRRLAPAVRERFSWKPAAGAEIRYAGEMAVVRSSRLGWVMAQVCRLIRTDLILSHDPSLSAERDARVVSRRTHHPPAAGEPHRLGKNSPL
jgi:hypothetical protein